MFMFLIALSVIAVMVFVEWQYSVMRRRLRVRSETRRQSNAVRRGRRS